MPVLLKSLFNLLYLLCPLLKDIYTLKQINYLEKIFVDQFEVILDYVISTSKTKLEKIVEFIVRS